MTRRFPIALALTLAALVAPPLAAQMRGPMMTALLGDYPHSREASGTSWTPQSTPVEGFHFSAGTWRGMMHGRLAVVRDDAGGPRGDEKSFAAGMFMVMGERDAGGGTLGLRGMISPDPLMGPAGYPLLLQTGESADGRAELVDRQHPHDFVMELAASWSRPLARRQSVFIYAGLPGEPAIGPTAFMHRYSGMEIPAAPIGHHWLDSTHVAEGVVTVGWVAGNWKLEGSRFRGREPDHRRWDIETPRLDSHAFRLSWNPGPDWSLQASGGRIHSPEALHPDEDVTRWTASATKNWHPGAGFGQTTLAWGRNRAHGEADEAWLVEQASRFGAGEIVSARWERVEKGELFPEGDALAGRYTVRSLGIGYAHEFPRVTGVAPALGVWWSRAFVPAAIRGAYGGHPDSFMLYARIRVR